MHDSSTGRSRVLRPPSPALAFARGRAAPGIPIIACSRPATGRVSSYVPRGRGLEPPRARRARYFRARAEVARATRSSAMHGHARCCVRLHMGLLLRSCLAAFFALGCAGRSIANGDEGPCDLGTPLEPPGSTGTGGSSSVAGRAGSSSASSDTRGTGGASQGTPAPPTTHCEGSCSGCDPARGVCFIQCNGDGACTQAELVCPPDWPCEISCHGADSCIQADVYCPAGYRCSLDCGGAESCIQLTYHCSGSGCELSCGNRQACEQLERE